MNFETKTMILIFIVNLPFVHPSIFVHQSVHHDILSFSDCTVIDLPSISICAAICEKNGLCLNFAYNKAETLCRYNCRIFWNLTKTNEGPTYFERKSENLALLKPGSSSSVAIASVGPENALDGYLSPKLNAEETFHSAGEVSPWFEVDLQTVSDTDYLKIYNRWDAYGERLNRIKVQIDQYADKCDDYVGPASDAQVVFIPCQPTARGRYVRLYINGSPGDDNALTIAELEIRHFK